MGTKYQQTNKQCFEMKSSLCTPTCHLNQLNFSLGFLLTIFQNIPHSLLADAHVESWMQSGAQSHALPNLCCGYFSHGGPGRGPGGCRAESFQPSLTPHRQKWTNTHSVHWQKKGRQQAGRVTDRAYNRLEHGGETFFLNNEDGHYLFIFAFVFQ